MSYKLTFLCAVECVLNKITVIQVSKVNCSTCLITNKKHRSPTETATIQIVYVGMCEDMDIYIYAGLVLSFAAMPETDVEPSQLPITVSSGGSSRGRRVDHSLLGTTFTITALIRLHDVVW